MQQTKTIGTPTLYVNEFTDNQHFFEIKKNYSKKKEFNL